MGRGHINIPVFIPHYGCGHQCVFCNQRIITGINEADSPEGIYKQIADYLDLLKHPEAAGVQIAFFGGSFTGIERNIMIEYLRIADFFIKEGKVSGIRISTRPDYIDDDILEILSFYNVRTIELGIQSMSDDVLEASGRGHTARDAEIACEMIKHSGFGLAGQMMLGLPNSDIIKEADTARKIVSMGADSARIYPVVVLEGSELEAMKNRGVYFELPLDEAVLRAAHVKKIFNQNGVDIIRMGLCASENIAGTQSYHPSFGELVESFIIYEDICGQVDEAVLNGKNITEIIIHVETRYVSKATGQKRTNIKKLQKRYSTEKISVKSHNGIRGYRVEII